MYIILENDYYTGQCSSSPISPQNPNQTVIQTSAGPNELDYLKQQAYKWDNTTKTWIFDQTRYTELLYEQELAWQPNGWPPNTHQAKIEYLAMMQDLDISCDDYTIDNVTDVKFRKVRSYYKYKHWSDTMVKNAVVKGWITADEFKTITGQDYVE